MFEQLNQRWLDGRQILKIDEIPCGDALHPQCGVHFADDKEPKVAVVHSEELKYLVFDNEEDSIKKRGLGFSTATYDLQKGFMDALRVFNPKYKEQKEILANIKDSLDSLRDRLDRAVFADENGNYDEFTFTLGKIIEVIKTHGKEVDYGAFGPKGLKILQAVIEMNLSYKEVCLLMPPLAQAFNHLFQQACEAALNMPASETRMRDMIDFVEAYEAIHGAPKELKEPAVPVASESIPAETAPIPEVPEVLPQVAQEEPAIVPVEPPQQ